MELNSGAWHRFNKIAEVWAGYPLDQYQEYPIPVKINDDDEIILKW